MEIDKQTQLSIENITLSFGGVHALSDVSVDMRNNEILAIIGPNGAGKTALLNCINGFYKPQKGEIYYGGQRITRMRPDKLAKLGIARTFQNIELYTGLSTQDNIMASRHVLMRQNFLTGALYLGWAQKEDIAHRQIVEEIIDFLEIATIRKKHVGLLPYGLRKRVELARALALEPKVVLLDEPMAGMNLEEEEDIARFIIDVFEGQGATYPDTPVLRDGIKCIILVEHDMGVVMDIADRIIVLDFGRKIAEGTPAEISANPEVIIGKIRDRVESSSPAGKWWVIKGYPGHKYSPPGARASAPGQPPAVITGELLESLTYNVRFSPGQVWVLGSIEAGVIYARILEYGGMAGWGYIAPRPYVEPVIYNRMVLQECSNIFSEELKSAGFGKYVISKGKIVTTRPTKKV